MNKISSLLMCGALALGACTNDIPDNERYVATDDVVPARTVLIEEYTGQLCVNCPDGHAMLSTLEERYNNSEHVGVISVGHHVKEFSMSTDEGGFYTPETEHYAADFETAPSARFNRNGAVQGLGQWMGALMRELVRPTPIRFTGLTAQLLADGSSITLEGSYQSDEAETDCYLQLWLLEKGVVAPQMLPDGSIDMAYHHHNIYRAAINGINGEPVDIRRQGSGNFKVESHAIPAVSNPDSLRVVAFIYSAAKGVFNARMADVEVNK